MKEFNSWNEKKIIIEETQGNERLIHARQVWWCSVGLNLGDEENGKPGDFERPVIILKKFNNRVFIGLPLSTKQGDKKFYFEIYFLNKIGYIILSQVRLYSVKRLRRLMGVLDIKQFDLLYESFIRLLNK